MTAGETIPIKGTNYIFSFHCVPCVPDSKSEVLDLVLKHKQNILGFTKFLTCNGIQKREKNLQITPKSFLKEQ